MERITFDNYRDYPAINQSKLKSLSKDPEKVIEDREDWNDGMEFGDVLDLILFTPELFDERYYVADLDNLPSDRIQGIIEDAVERHGAEITDEMVLAAADRDEYGMTWGNDTRLRKILEEGDGARYAQILMNSQDKKILSIERHMEIVQAAEVLKTHNYTSDFIAGELPEGWERLTQVALLSCGKPLFKGLIDLMLVDHNEKVIYPWDLKSTGRNPLHFAGQFVSQQYYLQAALYQWILENLIAEAEEGTNVQELTDLTFNPAGYTVDNFGFIVIGSADSTKPLRYKCTDEDIYSGLYGGELRTGREVKGVMELAEELQWHEDNNKWQYPYEVYQNDGELELDIF